MNLIVALDRLTGPGGPQTYALTIAEQLVALGHHVTLFARELGPMAQLARDRRLLVAAGPQDLPERADGVIVGVDRSLAVELAGSYPAAARVFVIHGVDEIHLPAPVEGVVAATVALNDRFAARARSCVGAGEIVRLRQPVDLRRLGARGRPAPRPARVLLLGNYHRAGSSRIAILQNAWSHAHLEWVHVGEPDPQLEIQTAMYGVDIVVGYGRCIVEAMASGKPAYVFDHAGGDGWITPESYPRIEAAGFSGLSDAPPADAARLRADLDAYDPDLGRLGHDLARTHHDVRRHVDELIALLRRLAPDPQSVDRSALHTIALLTEAQMRAEIAREHNRQETRLWFDRAQSLNERLVIATAEGAQAKADLAALRATRRFRIASALARCSPRAFRRRRSARRRARAARRARRARQG